MRIRRENRVLATNIRVADTLVSRGIGLIGRKELSENEGLFFPNCRSIHMWFMSMVIDVGFLSETDKPGCYRLDRVFSQLRPWRLLPVQSLKSKHALETRAGWFDSMGLVEGDMLCID